jgi:AraC family transcriptional regulator of arabinose operon
MKIGTIGCHYRRDAGCYFENPKGLGCGFMALTKSPAVFVLNNKKISVPESSFIVFTPDTPFRYGSDDIFVYDWIFFDFEEGDENFIRGLDIPINEVVLVKNADELSQILQQVSYEHHIFDKEREMIESRYMELFFLKLSRSIRTATPPNSLSTYNKHYFFVHLRNCIYSNPDEMSSVAEIAKYSGMSYSGFQHSYKRFFGVSVLEDITKSRFLRAERLLTTTSLNVNQIAQKCGYISEYSFMRKFKQIYGMTPTEYRKTF